MSLSVKLRFRNLVCLVALTVVSAVGAAQDADSFDVMLNGAVGTVAKSLSGKVGKVAVMDFPSFEGKVTGLSNYISNRTSNQFVGAGREVVDRALLERIVKEQKLQQSALMDPATAAKIGKLAGAKYFVVGNYARLPRTTNLTIRLLSVETGQFLSAQEISIPMNGDNSEQMNALLQMSGTVAQAPSLDDKSAGDSDAGATAPVKPKAAGKGSGAAKPPKPAEGDDSD